MTWRAPSWIPPGWKGPPPIPRGFRPNKSHKVTLRGIFEGKRRVLSGKILEVYARKGNGRASFQWYARVRWNDGTRSEVQIEKLMRRLGGWLLVREGKLTWH